jgi:hypothetical protein
MMKNQDDSRYQDELRRLTDHYTSQKITQNIMNSLWTLINMYSFDIVRKSVTDYIFSHTWLHVNLMKEALDNNKAKVNQTLHMNGDKLWADLQTAIARYGYTRKPKKFYDDDYLNEVMTTTIKLTYPKGWISACSESSTFNSKKQFLENIDTVKRMIDENY